MTRSRAELEHWDRHHVWHAFTQMQEYEPLLIERGEGAWLVDVDGNRYLDGSASMWCNVHGHRHPRLDAALAAQAAKVAHTTNLGLSNPTTVEFARQLCELAPPGLDRIFFSDDGSTAIEAALKMAFQFWRQTVPARPEKTRFVAIDEAYHGDTLGAVGVGGVDRFTAMFAPLTFAPLRLPPPGMPDATGRVPSLGESLGVLEGLLAAHGHEIAAVVMEPLVQMAGGIIVHPPGYLRGVRELTHRHEVLLILDEVATGFGRTGTLFAFYHGHTYGGNPLAAAVGLASLEIFQAEGVLDRLPAKIERLATHAARLAMLPGVGAVRQCGLVAGIELVADKATGRHHPAHEQRGRQACEAARKHGALLRQLGDVVVLMPPLCVSDAELDCLTAAAEAGIIAAHSAGHTSPWR